MNRRYFLQSAMAAAALTGAGTVGAWGAGGRDAKAKRPNILFAIADDASFPHMGAYGCDWVNTPAFDRVARDGVLFTRAYTPNAKCAPSRSCILTGRNSWQLEEAANHWSFFPNKFKTYAEALSEHRYHVGYTAKGLAPVTMGKINGVRRLPTGKAYNARKAKPPAKGITTNDYAENFKDFLKDRPADQPFCFWYGSVEPHRGYEFRSGIEKGGKKLEEIDKIPAFWPQNDTVRTDMLDYAFELEHFDNHLARMIKTLEDAGELENTLVVVTADNGMPFPRVKGQEYEYSNHLPLAVMWAKGIKNPGRKVDDFVSFIDFTPTFLEVAGLEEKKSGMAAIEGRSLTDIFNATKGGIVNPARDHVLIGKERHDVGRPHDQGYPIRGIVKGDHLYVRNFKTDRWPAGNPETGYLNTDGSPTKTEVLKTRTRPGERKYWQGSFGKRSAEELYNIRKDPECVHNLAGVKQFAQIKKALASQMEKELLEQDDPRIQGKGDIFDQYKYSHAGSANFYERQMKGEKPSSGWVNASDFEEGPLD